MRSHFDQMVRGCGVMVAALALVSLGACGGSSTAATTTTTTTTETSTTAVTQSDIVLPLSVQVVTAN